MQLRRNVFDAVAQTKGVREIINRNRLTGVSEHRLATHANYI